MQGFKLDNSLLNRKAFSNAVSKKRNKKSGKRLYLSAIHKRVNKEQQEKRLLEFQSLIQNKIDELEKQ